MQQQQSEIILEKKIGSGSFGDVFSGHMRTSGEKIAVKRVKKKILYQYGDYLVNAFWKEINSMKLCECENSVRLIQNLETENNYNIVMELCDIDLLCYLNQSPIPFSVEDVRDIFLKLNNVFRIMQKNNIVHRDLKLGNILLKFTDNSHKKFIPKLSDYGFSKDLNNNNYTATHLGTPATMAPEIMMNLPYNEKSDLWSIGAMMYQLHYKDIPYPGFSEQQILRKIQTNYPRKQPADPNFRDLLNRLFIVDPKKRITWEEYFNHPFFKVDNNKQKNQGQYEKISDFDFGYNYNIKEKDLFYCYIAKDNKTGKKVLIKSYREDLMEKNNQLFSEEIALFKAFKGNQSVLSLINMTKENHRVNMIFEYVEAESLMKFIQNKVVKEKHIKKFNKILYDDIFIFNECNFLPFIFISIHNFLVNKDFIPKVFDFGLHKLLIPQEEFNSYYLPDTSEINIMNQNRIKTNVMNYGITLLKLFSGNKLEYKGKEIVLPEDKIMSEDFSNFMSKCLARNIRKRFTWFQLGSYNFILDNNVELSNIVGNSALIDDQKLTQIFDSLNNKFDLIINYFNKINFNENNEFISQIEIFVNVTLFEMKIVSSFFNRDIYKKPFTNQNEISFISIGTDSIMKKLDLNMINPVLRDLVIIKMNDNKLIKDFLPNLHKKIKKLEKLAKSIAAYTKESSCSRDITNFIQNVINSVYTMSKANMQQYFLHLMNKSVKEKNNELKYDELVIAKYIIELIIFVITIVNDSKKRIYFKKDVLLKKFYEVFGEEKNKIEISTVNNKEVTQKFLIISFLPVLFKCKEANFIGKMRLSKDKQSINKLVQYYPSLMKKISETKVNKK